MAQPEVARLRFQKYICMQRNWWDWQHRNKRQQLHPIQQSHQSARSASETCSKNSHIVLQRVIGFRRQFMHQRAREGAIATAGQISTILLRCDRSRWISHNKNVLLLQKRNHRIEIAAPIFTLQTMQNCHTSWQQWGQKHSNSRPNSNRRWRETRRVSATSCKAARRSKEKRQSSGKFECTNQIDELQLIHFLFRLIFVDRWAPHYVLKRQTIIER